MCVNPYHYERTVPSALDISSLALSPPVERRKGKVPKTRLCNYLPSGIKVGDDKEDGFFGKQRRHSGDLQQHSEATSHPASMLRLSVQSLLDEGPLRKLFKHVWFRC